MKFLEMFVDDRLPSGEAPSVSTELSENKKTLALDEDEQFKVRLEFLKKSNPLIYKKIMRMD